MYALKRELKLNNVETSLVRGLAGFRRFVYNYGLELLTSSWEFVGIKANDNKRLDAIKKVFTQVTMRRCEYAWMKKYPSTVYQSAFIDLKNALSRWRQGVAKFPKFKNKKKGDSFTVYKTSGVYPIKGEKALPFTNKVIIKSGKVIKLPGFKKEIRLKEAIDFICASQTFTVSRTANKWFVSFAIDAEKIPPRIHTIEKIGVDLGVKCLATCSDGSTYDMPITTKKAKTIDRRSARRVLGKIQWHNRNKQMGNRNLKIRASNNAKDYFNQVAKQQARIANIRQDTIQQMTTDISRKAFIIRIEDLNVSGMVANHKLAEAVSNNCFYEIRRQLIYKQVHYGTKVELVDRWYPSSKTCSACGSVQPMPLLERTYNCNCCKHVQDRDLNAAINLCNAPTAYVRIIDKIRLA